MYEGSQQSLTDMAARQAQAVDRLGRLRSAVAVALRRRFPRAVLEAEAAAGRRLADLDDEALVAQFEALVASDRRTGMEQLRAALAGAGMTMPEGHDLSAWAASVTAQRLRSLPVADGGLDDLFTDGRETASDLSGLFGDAGVGGSEPSEQPGASEEDGPRSSHRSAPSAADAPKAGGAPTAGATGAGGTAVSAGRGEGAGEGAAGGGGAPPAESSAAPGQGVSTGAETVRPEVAKSTRGRSRKGRRTRAVPPGVPLPLPEAAQTAAAAEQTPGEEAGGEGWMTEEMMHALAAACDIPRPVFASDLVAIAGSMDKVIQWERRCRRDNLPVRIVPAKMRHSRRGSLVLPEAAPERDASGASGKRRSVWGDVLASEDRAYRGSRLYELAVLLHRVAEQVVSHRLGPATATFRLSQPGGLAGVVVLLGGDLSDEEVRAELLSRVEELVSERLSGVAVLTTNGDQAAYTQLTETVASAGRERGWQPTMPVVAGRSWEYADTRGSSVDVIMGA